MGEGVARERSICLSARVKEIRARESGRPKCVGKYAFKFNFVNKNLTYFRAIQMCCLH